MDNIEYNKSSLSTLQFTSTGYVGILQLEEKQKEAVKKFNQLQVKRIRKRKVEKVIRYQPRRVINYRLQICNESDNVRINRINTMLENTRLADYGNLIVSFGHEYNLSPYFITAVAMQETSGGKYTVGENNIFNIKGINGRWKNYNSVYDSINDFCSLISNYYLGKGLDNISSIGSVYCPSEQWSVPVENLMNQLSY